MARFKYPIRFLDTTETLVQGDIDTFIPYPGKPISLGSRGNDVIDVQDKLVDLGYNLGFGERGVYDLETEKNVRIYQEQNGINPTGVVEVLTWEKLFGKAPRGLSSSAAKRATLENHLLQSSASYTMDGSSQVTLTYLDPNYSFMKAGQFRIRRRIQYQGRPFEIASIETQQSSGGSPQVIVEARSAPIQQMKRDKKPEAYGQMSASDFALMIAGRYGLSSLVEPTQKVQTIVKAKNPNSDESTWDVLVRLANDNQFVCFESRGMLIFASQPYIMGKLGTISLSYPPNDGKGRATLIGTPKMRKSDDESLEASGSATVDRSVGEGMRAGQTVRVSGIPEFNGSYLVTEVRFEDNVPDPVEIFFRTPQKPQAKAPTSSSGGSSSGLPNTL